MTTVLARRPDFTPLPMARNMNFSCLPSDVEIDADSFGDKAPQPVQVPTSGAPYVPGRKHGGQLSPGLSAPPVHPAFAKGNKGKGQSKMGVPTHPSLSHSAVHESEKSKEGKSTKVQRNASIEVDSSLSSLDGRNEAGPRGRGGDVSDIVINPTESSQSSVPEGNRHVIAAEVHTSGDSGVHLRAGINAASSSSASSMSLPQDVGVAWRADAAAKVHKSLPVSPVSSGGNRTAPQGAQNPLHAEVMETIQASLDNGDDIDRKKKKVPTATLR